MFKKRIITSDYSLSDYDELLIDLDICFKMHNEK